MKLIVAAVLSIVTTVLAQPVLITGNTTVGPTATTITPTAGGPPVALATADITVGGSGVLTMSGRHSITSLTLSGTSTLRHASNAVYDYGDAVVNGLNLSMTGAMTVAATATVNLDGLGFAGASGPGAGTDAPSCCYGGGGGHGGTGATFSIGYAGGTTYGSFAAPDQPGSGGGHRNGSDGGPGGGVIRLNVNGVLTVNGAIRANGLAGTQQVTGSGAGGSIWITANSVAGSGSITAQGGTGFDRTPGGGGRIAVYSCFNTLPPQNVTAIGPGTAGEGTVYIARAGGEILPLIDAICGGSTAELTVRAGGVGTLTYQWRRNGATITDGPQPSGAAISGTNATTLRITGFTPAEDGDYDVVVTAQCGTATSNAITARICRSDVDCDGDSDSDDIVNFFAEWEQSNAAADVDFDGDTDSDDIIVFFAAFESGCI